MPKITFIKNGNKIEVVEETPGDSLLNIAHKNGIEMDSACGGNGICTTCMVKMNEGIDKVGEMTEREEIMGMDPDDPTYRLGCQTSVQGDCEAEIAF